jgi:glycosyltransferase involved in cell wall biosynthesis
MVSMPYWRTPETVARAVGSVLGQTHRALTLVVLNDGDDPTHAWAPLAHVDDPRLVRFDLPQNGGRYRADAIALAACPTEFFMVHDSDDWSDPDRLERLLAKAEGRDVVLGGYRIHRQDGSTRDVAPTPELISDASALRHVAHHTALFRTEALRSIGGPHPGYRVSYDTFMIDVAVLTLRWAVVREPLYHYRQRPDSLVSDRRTGMRSPYRQKIRAELATAWSRYRTQRALPPVSPALRAEVAAEAERLSRVLGGEERAAVA